MWISELRPDNNIFKSRRKNTSACTLLGVGRKIAFHNLLERCAEKLSLSYFKLVDVAQARTPVAEKSAQIAVFEFDKYDEQVLGLCRKAYSVKLPVLIIGHFKNKQEVLAAVRAGAHDLLISPAAADKVIAKLQEMLLHVLETAPVGQKTEVSPLDFGEHATPAQKALITMRRAQQILVLPHAIGKLIGLCEDSGSKLKSLQTAILSDPALSAMVIKRANSVAYAGVHRITAITEAIVRVGTLEIKKLAIALSVLNMFKNESKNAGFNRYMFWIHCLGAGIAASHLAVYLPNKIDAEEAFMVGIFHDLGKIIFDDYMHAEYQKALSLAATSDRRIVEVEQELFELDHSMMGSKVGEKWKLPEGVVRAIANHHKHDRMMQLKAPGLVSLEQIACMGNSIIKAIGLGHSGDFYVDDIAPEVWQLLSGSVNETTELVTAIRKELTDFSQLLGLDREEAYLTLEVPERQEEVAIVAEGLGRLLHFFFVARGYQVKIIGWDELEQVADCSWVACDSRNCSAKTISALRDLAWSGKQHILCLGDEKIKDLPTRMKVIAPATDFFQIELLFRED